MSLVRAAVLIATVALGVSASPAHAGDWTVGEITGPAGTTRIQPTAVNAAGVVVGNARFAGKTIDTAFRWENGVMIELAHPGGMELTRAADINDQGVIVGWAGSENPDNTSLYAVNGAVWTATQTTSSVSLTSYNLYGAAFATSGPDWQYGSSAHAINEAGQIAGRAGVEWTLASGAKSKNHLPTTGTGGGWSPLQMPVREGGFYGGSAVQINESGDVLGSGGPGADRARVWIGGGGTGTEYDVFPGSQGFNGLRMVAGRMGTTNANQRARLWDGSAYREIGASPTPVPSMAHAVNNAGWAVGRAGTQHVQSILSSGNAYLWRPNEAPASLFSLAGTGWSMYSAADINEDGMIVGTGTRGGVAMGFWMAPASIAHELTGKVYGPTGDPVAGATVRVVNAAGNEQAAPVTGADGSYKATLPRGGPYDITVQPAGAYLPNGLAGCTVIGSTCRLNMGWNRTVDFYASSVIVPPAPGAAGAGAPGGGAAGGSGGAGAAGGGPATGTKGPTVTIPRKNRSLTVTGGAVGFKLGPFGENANGTVRLQSAGKVKASAKAAVLTLGQSSFKAKKGKALVVKVKLTKKAARVLKKRRTLKAVATVTARDALGNVTTKRFAVTVRARRGR